MRYKKGEKVNGWLIIDKPEGMGSTTVVNQTRHMLNAQKNGHTGTLDPFATGVLPIAFGEATKLISYVMDGDKEYEFVLNFGTETDTLDCTGKELNSGGKIPTEEEIKNILPFFEGEIEQVPPAFSAIKVDGKRAYDLARKGEDVEMKPRKVRIERIELLEILPEGRAKFRVACSKGTYVRTLGADLAKKLGTWGFLSELRRTKCANFGLEHTILLENLKTFHLRTFYTKQVQFDGPNQIYFLHI